MTIAIDLSRLPAPLVVEALDFETIYAAMKADLLSRDPSLDAVALESEPAAKILEVCAYRELLLRQRVNDAARAVMLAYATTSDLDHLGGNREEPRLAGEADSSFRTRVQLAYHKTAAAGPWGLYKAIALGVDPRIRDVSVVKLNDGEVTVTVLAYEILPEQECEPEAVFQGQFAFPDVDPPSGQAVVIAPADSPILLAVLAALNDEFVRPLTDVVIVRPPAVQTYSVEASLSLYPGPDSAPVVEESLKDLDAYLASIRKVGYDATRAGFLDALVVPGVQNAILTEPAEDVVAGPTELALCVGMAIGVQEARTQ